MIPKVIIDAQEYRREVAESLGLEIIGKGGEVQDLTGGEEGVLELDANQTTVKDRTRHAFIKLYEEQGYDVFMENAIAMKKKGSLGEAYGHFKGELAEVVLYVTISEFIKAHNLNWKMYHSLVIPHKNGVAKATTECDLVLVSQEIITVFEAKSNTGAKTLDGVCTLNIPNRPAKDIYNQNALHCHSLLKQIEHLNLGTSHGMMPAYFLFDDGTLVDKREDKHKRLMPALTEKNLVQYLSALTKLTTKNWKPEIFDVMEELSKKLTIEDHKRFIQGGKKNGY